MALLRDVPGSVLWLRHLPADRIERLRATAIRRGVDGSRLLSARGEAIDRYLARFALADLFLDSFPYGAHTTASDALWMALPVLTISGRGFASRVCGSLVRAAGLRDVRVVSAGVYPPYTLRGHQALTWRYGSFLRALDGTPIADVLGFFYVVTARKPRP